MTDALSSLRAQRLSTKKTRFFVASKEADEESFSCDYILTKADAKKMRDAIDEWLRDEESRCDEDSAA